MDDANQDAQPEERQLIEILLTKDGQIKVRGSVIGDRTAAYGILETAKDAIRELHTPKVIKPQGNFLGGLRRNGVGH